MTREEKAIAYKQQGCNCCQAVLCAFEDELDLSVEDLKKIGAAFGMGMGCMEGNCGALCGAQIVLGLKEYQGYPIAAKARELHEAFKEKCGSTICKELKGIETGKVLCSCKDCIQNAVSLLEF